MNHRNQFVCLAVAGTVGLASLAVRAEQRDHWTYDSEAETISDGVWTFEATVLSEENREIRVWTVDAEKTGTLAAAMPLDFAKPIRVPDGNGGTVNYDAVELSPRTTSPTEDKVLTSAYVPKVSSFKFNPKTRSYPPAFLYSSAAKATALKGRLTFPSTLTELTGSSAFRELSALEEIEFTGPVALNGFRLLQGCSAVTNIIGMQYVTKISGNPCLTTGSKKLTSMGTIDLSNATVIDGETLQTTGCKVQLGPGLTTLGNNSLNGNALLGFPSPVLAKLGMSNTSGRQFEVADGKIVFPETLTTLDGATSGKNKKDVYVITGGSFMTASGVEEVVFPEGVTSVPTGLFDRCNSVKTVSFHAKKIDGIGLCICNSSSIKDIWFYGAAPDEGNLDDLMLAQSGTAGNAILDYLKANQLTIHVPKGKGWEKFADNGVIPGTITKGTTQKIKYHSLGMMLLLK